MGITFGRGAFENEDNPLASDDVCSSIVVLVDGDDRVAALSALERCIDRWWYIDGAGREHSADDAEFVEAPNLEGIEWHTAKYLSEPTVTPVGVEVYADVQSLMPAAMREAFRRVLAEELEAAGVRDAVVQGQDADRYRPLVVLAGGSWPPYQDLPVAGLPPGVPPGQLLHHQLRRRRRFRVPLLRRRFADAWEATAMAATDLDDETAVGHIGDLFERAAWRVGEPRATAQTNVTHVVGMPPVRTIGDSLLAAAAVTDRGIALITWQPASRLRDRGWSVPVDARGITTVSAYYENPA